VVLVEVVVVASVVVVVRGMVVVVVRGLVVVVVRGLVVVVVGASVVVVVVGASVVVVELVVVVGSTWAEAGNAARTRTADPTTSTHAPSSPGRAARRCEVDVRTKGGLSVVGRPAVDRPMARETTAVRRRYPATTHRGGAGPARGDGLVTAS
jgi:hypothetical protein